jgi:hypothetical protein
MQEKKGSAPFFFQKERFFSFWQAIFRGMGKEKEKMVLAEKKEGSIVSTVFFSFLLPYGN